MSAPTSPSPGTSLICHVISSRCQPVVTKSFESHRAFFFARKKGKGGKPYNHERRDSMKVPQRKTTYSFVLLLIGFAAWCSRPRRRSK